MRWMKQARAVLTLLSGIGILATIPGPAIAAAYPTASTVDSRWLYVTYHPDQVYQVRVAIGKACLIEFAKDEEMEKYFTGDLEAWDVAKHKNQIAIKPKAEMPDTNLIVTTNKRTYIFDLGLNERQPMYGIRFSYPSEKQKRRRTKQAKRALAAAINPTRQKVKRYRYAGRGPAAIRPVAIFDNGAQGYTFMKFAEGRRFPSIFRVDDYGKESLVNTTVRGNWLILPMIERRWRLRDGAAVFCIRNDNPPLRRPDNPSETAHKGILRAAR